MEVPMRRALALLAVLALTLPLWHCGENPAAVSDPTSVDALMRVSEQAYRYSAFDSLGKEVVRGMLFIAIDDLHRVSGRWRLCQTDPEARMIGPQVGSGTLEGMIRGKQIWVNLNPGNADNNVMLSGTYYGAVIEGMWQFVGFPGVLNSGTFRAASLKDRPPRTRRET